MRSSKSRSRSKSNRNRPQGANVVNRVFDSSGPEGKVRGTPQQIIDKYNQLARDAQLSNDRVATENFQQHAEHYLRMLNEAQREIDARREEQERQNRERQAERDRERAERLERQEREAGNRSDDPAAAPQPEVMDPRDSNGDSGLVETPESRDQAAGEGDSKPQKPQTRKPRSRKPKSEGGKPDAGKAAESKGDDTAATASSESAPADAGEAAPAPERKPAPRRKPKPKPSAEDAPEAAE
ncbi:DUF4167 domain-containing protein [Phaeobacter gallaeciensis]|uniref:DUF4167 domain-containing protein n=1 Tax=Phaeobacter gallaeciensis TaxID=60890 RepID=A0AAC9Z8F3_9RHOB|nr:DUF4167 domain-containing protein [Phaeobacter gallaeciensis]AHD09205.1 Domain protein of unknown function [Phaeobacter gallaeciensis DSM 26640]ATE92468.1 Domain protein of unknown function [Phaeobacter gallaeciensis]ATE97710.1 Domain protein of unknown function [Phaeobacter gallaeciensis]ATF01133.1 Domain protein of unknown function [Phaeobacter gallaeciensis]ATF05513.1 Domain protein of unknown function [Phaeobacter gallaeciensis]